MKNKSLTNDHLLKQIDVLKKKIKSLENTIALQSQIEESLKTSEKNLSAILEKNADGIIIVNMDGTVLYVNPAAEKLFGKSEEDFLGYPFGFPVSTDESGNSLVIRNGNAYCEVELLVVQMHWQKQSAFQLSVRDITEQKKSIDSIEYLASFPKLNPNPVVEIDMDYNINYMNPIAEKLFPDIKNLDLKSKWLTGIDSVIKIINNEKPNVKYRDVLVGEKWYQQAIDYVEKNNSIRIYGVDITARKKSEEALKKSEENLRSIMENSADAIFIADQNGKYVYTNKAVTDMLGFTLDEMRSKTVIDMAPKSMVNEYIELFKKVLAEGKGFTEIELLKKDGSYIMTDLNSVILPDGMVYGSCRDITERKQAEESLKISEIRYRRLFEAAKDGIIILDAETGMIVDVNPFLIKLLGYSHESFLGKTIWDIGFFKNIIANKATFQKLQQEKYIRYDDIQLETVDEKIIDVEFVSNVYLVGEREVIQCNIRDITERKKIEKDVSFKNIILTTQQEASLDGILAIDEKGKIISYNKRYIEIWGIPAEKLENRYDGLTSEIILNKVISADDFLKKVNYLYEHPTETSFDELNLFDGTILEMYSAPMIGYDGKYYGRIWSFRDISERKMSERMLIESEKMTEIAHLSAGVAHEFNNILAIIKSTSQLLLLEESLGKIRLDKRIIEELSIIDKQTIKGAEIVSNLMLFSKPDKAEKEYILIEDIIDDVLKLQKKQFEMENIEIIKKFNNKEKLLLNSGQIQQVFLNLSINALHAIKPKGKGKIEISSENDTQNVVVIFSDNGIGMNDEIKNNIFKPFFTTKGANANDDLGLKGTGLGLAVSSSIIKEYNGSISAESIENKGTEFKITFPLEIIGKEENLKNKEKEVRLDNLYNKKINILIVDDEINIADNIAKILTAYGFENIDVNYSSSHVLNKLKNQNYDLFFIDIMMPEMKGDVLIERIISDKKFDKSNIVIMSGSYSDQIKKIISLYEKCLFLKKPFSSDDILKILDNIFGGIK